MSENEVKIEVDKDGFIIKKGDFSANYYAEDFQTKLLHKAFLQLTKQLLAAKEENEKLKLDKDLWFGHYKQTCENMAVGDQIWAKRVNDLTQQIFRLNKELEG